ncbi:hypothetical protein LOTGIDRAFT_116491 [Lottia gigantea]|uniref:Glycoside hydrolase family 31 N-terminal domain-containing protein n=1 Tax=Lottia gigantea TaxID=225164 RepID=V4ALZ6_LOTGI|nr:hypothetical protein LOTGIDRAFT_116491 [Lottia gigantea]ESO95785.1 hypothetical protein LOTGIDRAFT_116491 [Lottia gigantea]
MGVKNPSSYKSCSQDGNVCVTWENDRKLVMTTRKENDVTCYDVSWSALSCVSQELKDCLNMSGHWYGGFQDWNQYWPMNIIQQKLAPYVASDSYAKMYGGVLERYFLSSAGYGVFIDQDVPLHLSMNENNTRQFCMSAKYTQYPYINYDNSLPYLNYSVCYANNIRKVHDYMSKTYIPRPENIPDEKLFKSPIWSTWAMYKKDINETQLEEFADDIISNNFPHSQIELDDEWTVRYGDMGFDLNKFPDPAAMVRRLNNKGFRVTIWVHPFFNEDSTSFKEAYEKRYLVRQLDSNLPALVSWWRGKLAGILDVTNPEAVSWYLKQLQNLKTNYNISSFKFDAGEVNWLPNVYSVNSTYRNPDVYTQKWAELAYESDKNIRHQEVRVGARTQRLPIFSRMLDRDSTWTRSNGLKTIIPCALTFGLIGYPFVLPDMIGGNAYDAADGLEARNYPDQELFIRWLQVNTFLPSMQFSVPPWIYNDTTLTTEARKLIDLHTSYTPTIVRLAREATVTGSPIIRPLWWVAPTDAITFMIDDEFLLGNDILVAPVVIQGDLSRDIYLPAGRWQDKLRNTVRDGGKWLTNYKASLYELPYFIRV